jgi:carboxymethylenebutenolidase
MATTATIRVHGSMMDVYLDGPAHPAPGPAIVLMYHRGGIDGFTKGVVERLAGFGYRVAVPDVYHRCPAAMPLAERKSLLKDSEVVADIAATLAELRARPDVAPDRIVLMGHCMGGRMALLGAGSLAEFRGLVVYYGGSVNRSWGSDGPTPFDRLRNIQCPVIGFFGDADTHPSPEDVNQIDAELSRHGIAHDFHRYPAVGHGFQNPAHDTPPERAAAEDAWAKTRAFLRKVAPV